MLRRWMMLIGLCLSCAASAYEYHAQDVLLRFVTGPNVNFVREEATTPGTGFLIGIEGEYMLDSTWGAFGAFKPVFYPDYMELSLDVGVHYRFVDAQTPFAFNMGVSLVPSVLFSSVTGVTHWNLGLRPELGFDYYVMRELAIGFEVGLTPSLLLNSDVRRFEAAVDVLLGVLWRI